jgi:trehalose 6-phosphate phosphatase
MTYLFARSNRLVLKRFARSNVLIAFDYDGTLAPIVALPNQAALRSTTRRLLQRVSACYPCVVISGRARRDVVGRIGAHEGCRVVGNHGAEPTPATAAMRRFVRSWLPILQARLRRYPGVAIEDKGCSVAVHYRHAPSRPAARRAVLAASELIEGVRVVGGKQVVNLVADWAPHKGVALERERLRAGCGVAIYVGDDDTDEDVFRLSPSRRLMTIRVGRTQKSRARYYIRRQAEIDRLLEALVTFRSRPNVPQSSRTAPS